MKKLVVICTLLFGFSLFAHAADNMQAPPPPSDASAPKPLGKDNPDKLQGPVEAADHNDEPDGSGDEDNTTNDPDPEAFQSGTNM